MSNYLDEFIGMAWNVAGLHPLMLEFVFWIAVLGIGAVLWALRPRFLERAECAWDRIARRRVLSIVLIGVTALALRAAILPLVPIPEPVVHDEYSYILGAETFASGRVTNPSHPMWIHFEGFHVNVVPTYQSMYPPAQSAFLAFGLLVFGHPWWGVWLSVGIMCAAITWMLQGWMPPRWALLGGAFCVLRFSLFSYFVNSYWGGAAAAIGGALVFGALPRIRKTAAAGSAIVFASGLGLLANSRPFEGFVLALGPMLWMVIWFLRPTTARVKVLCRVILPAGAVLAVCAAGMLYYNWRGTGNPLEMPYAVNQRQYHISKPFIWQTSYRIPEYHHPLMRQFYIHQEFPNHLLSQSRWGIQEITEHKVHVYYDFYIWPLFVLIVPALWIMLKSRRARLLAIAFLLVSTGLLVEEWYPQPHYAAGLTCVIIAIVLYGLRLLRTWRPLRAPAGLMLARAIVLALLIWMAFPTAQVLANPLLLQYKGGQKPLQFERARLQAQLERTPGKHLVIVHSAERDGGGQDWIYNDPDIEHGKVIWARDMGQEKNEELVRYFHDRQIWFIDQNDGVMRLQPYNQSSGETLAARRATAPKGQPN